MSKKLMSLFVIPWLGIITAAAVAGAAISVAETAVYLYNESQQTEEVQEVSTYGTATTYPNLAAGE